MLCKISSMQSRDALKLQKEWGNKPCKHPRLDKEYFGGADTGDWACVTCGEARMGRDWNKKPAKK